VVNADDFGLSEGVNRGIEASFREGILRSASLMANGAAFDDAVRIARQLPALGVGVHLTLMDERCIAPSGALGRMADASGRLPANAAEFTRGYLLRRFTVHEIRCEAEAQVQRILDSDIRPTHIDSHQHIHLLPGIFETVIDVVRSAGIPVVRVPYESGLSAKPRFNLRRAQLSVLRVLSRSARIRVRAEELRAADHFWGLSSAGALGTELLPLIGMARPGVNELMTHPGISDAALHIRYRWGYEWDGEMKALCSDAARMLVENRRIRLANFREAWGSTTVSNKTGLHSRDNFPFRQSGKEQHGGRG